MKVSDYINSFLKKNEVKFIFEMSGGMIAHILDSIYQKNEIKIVSMKHEQSAAFAADAVGRLTGRPGVAMATSGPGATNLITGIGSSYFDSSPTMFITGQVNRNELKKNRKIRQLGFQETDIVSIIKPITKKAFRANNAKNVPNLLEKAYEISVSGRPGPVLLDLPMDIQSTQIKMSKVKKVLIKSKKFYKKNLLKKLLLDLQNSKKPIVLVGGGIHSSYSLDLFREFIQLIKIPVVNSLMAVDALSYYDPLRVGFIGSYGNRWANITLSNSDFVLVLGSRLDVRQTGSQVKEFKGNKTIYHVDCEKGEINNRISGCVVVNSTLQSFLTSIIKYIGKKEFQTRKDWIDEINYLKNLFPDYKENSKISGINPNNFMHKLSKFSKKASVIVSDVGQHQMWAAQSLELRKNQRFLTSGGMGSMGFGLPASIGAAFTKSPSPIVLIAGDGGFQSNIQELQTVAHHNLPIKIVILNNRCHGMVRQFQEKLFDKRYQSTLWGYSAPNFEKIALSYGIKAKTIKTESEIEKALEWFWRQPKDPQLLQVMIDTFTNAYPKMVFGLPNYKMEPFKNLVHHCT
jgi:acetolactate synthase-1/2/3 large subunit